MEPYPELWGFCKKLLILSHGQATVERGFSINKEVEADNLQEDTIVTRRLVCDFISQHGGVTQVRMTPEHTSKMLNEKYLIIKIASSKKVTHTKMLNHLNL